MAKAKLSYEVKTCFEITLAQSDGGGSDSVDFEIVATIAAPTSRKRARCPSFAGELVANCATGV